MGFLGDRNPSGGAYRIPDLDINYGVGSRIQLTYEIPLGMQELRGDVSHVVAGLGNSLVGVKYRFYEHHYKNHFKDGERELKFSASIYPQLLLNNPTRSVARGIADPAPQMLLPMEVSTKIRWLRLSGEAGYWLAGQNVSNSWIRGVVAGHEFKKDTELYLELYDQQNVSAPPGAARLRESTLGLGGRIPIVKAQWLRLIGMAGRSVVAVTPSNGQPSWIAYVGLQFLSDRQRRHGDQ